MGILSLSLRPMMAKNGEKPFSDPRWIFEFKWDGIRAFYYQEGERWKIETRRGNVITRKFPEIRGIASVDAIIDGEIVVLRDGRPDFQSVLTRVQTEDPVRVKILAERMPAVFIAFDVVYAGNWVNEAPLEERKQILEDIVREPAIVIPYVEEDGEELYRKARRMGFEGIMAKMKGTPYEFGKRVPYWLKIKETRTVDAVICGVTLGEGKRAPYFGSLALGLYRGDKLVHVGNVGTGFSEAEMKEILDLLLPYRIEQPPCVLSEPPKRETIWVKPLFVAEVAYQAVTEDGKLRMPRFIRLRPDKSPEECTWSQLE